MSKRHYGFNLRISFFLFLSCLIAGSLFGSGAIKNFLYVQIVVFGFLLFFIFRVLVPFVFTKMDTSSTPEMQKKIRSTALGRFFIIGE